MSTASPQLRGRGRGAGLLADPRRGQVLCLSALLILGIGGLGFDIAPERALVVLAAALATQGIACRALGLPFDPLSPAITALGLVMLLRTDTALLAALGATLAIAGKFAIRVDGRHLFNPSALSLVALPLLVDGAWISPGQWGSEALLAILVAGFGALVAGRAARLDTTLGFLAAWAALCLGRALWLGDPLTIPLHQMQSGALMIFAFFMISDPATTPLARPARLLHAAAVAGLGFALQTLWITDTGPILALVLLAPLVPLLNRARLRPAKPAPRLQPRETT